MTCSGCAKRLGDFGCWRSAPGAAPTAAAAREMQTAVTTAAVPGLRMATAPQTRLATPTAQLVLRRPPLACRRRARAPPARLPRPHGRGSDQTSRKHRARQRLTLTCRRRPRRPTQVRLRAHPSSSATRTATAATGVTTEATISVRLVVAPARLAARAPGLRAGVRVARAGAMSAT